jgi:hypothetical protein
MICALLLYSATAQAAEIEIINVKDVGALGDGKTDDTKAIQAAVDAAGKKRRTIQNRAEGGKTEIPLLTAPKLYFPAGDYVISDVIDITNVLNIEADPYAALNQKNPEKDIFYSKHAWYLNIKGLSFIGGAVQLNLNNPNVSGGVVTVADCLFWNANKWALIVNIESTTFTMNNSHIFNAMQGMYLNRCDVVMVRDGWWLNDEKMKNKAFIENRAQRVMFQNICANPRPNGFDQRWIDNYGTNLTLKQIRFGGEGGGFTPVVNFREPGNVAMGPSIIIEDSWCCNTSNAKREAVIYCEEIPNIISLRDNNVTSRYLVQFADTINLKTYFKEKRVPRSLLSFQAEGNVGGVIEQRLPKGLLKPAAAPDVTLTKVSGSTVKKLIKNAIAEWEAKAPPDMTEGRCNDHQQKTDPADYIDVTLESAIWSADENMDASRIMNSEFLAFAEAGSDILYVWKRDADMWPHFTVKVKGVDLDQFPWLTWRSKATDAPPGIFVRAILRKAGITANIEDTQFKKDAYRAHNLKEILGMSGVHDIELRVYPFTWGWVFEEDGTTIVHDESGAMQTWNAAQGSYGAFDFIRFEAQ